MRISHGRNPAALSQRRSEGFTGTVWGDPVLSSESGVTVNAVFFEPKSRTNWHRHSEGQVLVATHGYGFLWSRDGEGGPLAPGDVAHIAPGEEHWHGAGPGSYLLHIAVSLGDTTWLDPVTNSDYDTVCGLFVAAMDGGQAVPG
jgi:quercetin dioxygenase-like cupin family protein